MHAKPRSIICEDCRRVLIGDRPDSLMPLETSSICAAPLTPRKMRFEAQRLAGCTSFVRLAPLGWRPYHHCRVKDHGCCENGCWSTFELVDVALDLHLPSLRHDIADRTAGCLGASCGPIDACDPPTTRFASHKPGVGSDVSINLVPRPNVTLGSIAFERHIKAPVG